MVRLQNIGLVIFFLISMQDIVAQDRMDLKKIKGEIKRLEADLKAKEDEENTILEQIQDINRKIGLQRTLLKELEDQKRRKERNIKATSDSLRLSTWSYERRKRQVAQRMVSMYKRGRIADWAALFSRHSLSQAVVWLKYQKKIIESDHRNLRILQEKKMAVKRQNQRLKEELSEKNLLIQEKMEETSKLDEQLKPMKELRKKLQQDKTLIQKQREEKLMALREIEGIIKRKEEERKKVAVEGGINTNFAELKGNLDWPVKGEVVTKFGIQRNPTLGTETPYYGIDIKAVERDVVRAVCNGKVIVYWIRGMGNLVFLDHGGGYYTVYGHLDMLLVESGDNVDRGEVIGHLGDNQSLYESTLHFQVWNGNMNYDPEAWLR